MNKKTNILIVNDDGIESYGIAKLAAMAANFGDVWVVAPEGQCSGMSQKLTIFSELNVQEREFPATVRAAYSVSGTPADCVKVALHALLDFRPDVVLSGVNDGMNAGHDVCYSGTVGAATEAALNGIHTIAFSMGKASAVDVAEQNLPAMLEELLFAPLNPGELWNVNFPDCAASACKGILRGRVPAACSFYDNEYDRAEGALSIRVSNPGPEQCREGSDIHAILHGYVSIGEVRSPLF